MIINLDLAKFQVNSPEEAYNFLNENLRPTSEAAQETLQNMALEFSRLVGRSEILLDKDFIQKEIERHKQRLEEKKQLTQFIKENPKFFPTLTDIYQKSLYPESLPPVSSLTSTSPNDLSRMNVNGFHLEIVPCTEFKDLQVSLEKELRSTVIQWIGLINNKITLVCANKYDEMLNDVEQDKLLDLAIEEIYFSLKEMSKANFGNEEKRKVIDYLICNKYIEDVLGPLQDFKSIINGIGQDMYTLQQEGTQTVGLGLEFGTSKRTWDTIIISRDSQERIQALAFYGNSNNHLTYLISHPDNIRHSINDNEVNRMKGAGSAIIQSLVSENRKKQLPLTLESTKSAIDFYKKFGFRDRTGHHSETGYPLVLENVN